MSFSPSHNPTYPPAAGSIVAQQPASRQSMTLDRKVKNGSAATEGQREQQVEGDSAMRLRGGCPGHLCGLPILPCKCDIWVCPCCC